MVEEEEENTLAEEHMRGVSRNGIAALYRQVD